MTMVVNPPPTHPGGVFVLATPRHMLAKLGWEISQLKQTLRQQVEILGAIRFAGYQAFNCAVTAWHCADWAWAYADDELKSAIAMQLSFMLKSDDRKNRESFFDAVCEQSRDIELCRHIANSSKHLKLDNRADRGFQAQVNAFTPLNRETGQFESKFGLRIIDERNESAVPLKDVFERAFTYWQRLYGDLGYIEGTFVDSRD